MIDLIITLDVVARQPVAVQHVAVQFPHEKTLGVIHRLVCEFVLLTNKSTVQKKSCGIKLQTRFLIS